MKVYSEPSKTSKRKLFAKILNDFQEKSSIFDIWLGSEYASDNGNAHKSLIYCNSRTSKQPWKFVFAYCIY